MRTFGAATALSLAALLTTTSAPAVGQAITVPAVKILKQKIAIGRFSNETRYGQSLL